MLSAFCVLDITGAFDNLSLEAAEQGMEQAGFNPTIRAWYSHYLHNRQATADVKGCTAVRQLTRGTPQGGVLNPLIWNLAFDDLLNLFNTGPVHIKGFADDAALLICGKDPHTLVHRMQIALNKAYSWGVLKGLP